MSVLGIRIKRSACVSWLLSILIVVKKNLAEKKTLFYLAIGSIFYFFIVFLSSFFMSIFFLIIFWFCLFSLFTSFYLSFSNFSIFLFHLLLSFFVLSFFILPFFHHFIYFIILVDFIFILTRQLLRQNTFKLHRAQNMCKISAVSLKISSLMYNSDD